MQTSVTDILGNTINHSVQGKKLTIDQINVYTNLLSGKLVDLWRRLVLRPFVRSPTDDGICHTTPSVFLSTVPALST